MQRQLSSFDIFVIVTELQKLVGCQVEKIYQISRDEILIRVKNIEIKKKYKIYIRNSEFIALTQKDFDKPTNPSNFAMTLRKYLSNGRILDISQHEFDRIIKIKIGKKEGEYSLILEFFSNGNMILVDPKNRILLPLIRQSWKDRKIKGREPYLPPPSQINPFNLTLKSFSELLKKSDSDLVRTLAVNINLSGPIAEEICTRANVNKKLKINDIDDETIKKVYDSLMKFLEIFEKQKFKPVFVKKDGKVIDILPFEFDSYEDVDFEKVPSLLKGLNEFIKIEKKKEVKKQSHVDKIKAKLQRQLDQQKTTIKKFEKQIQEKKNEGDLIYLNFQDIKGLLNEIKQALELKDKKKAIERINSKDIVKIFNPKENLLILNLKDIDDNNNEVKISFRMSVAENAEKAYNDLKKIKSKLKGAEKSIKKTKAEIQKVIQKKKAEEVKSENKVEKKEHTFWFERYRWFISSEGNIIVGGKDAKSNDLVVKKYLKQGDRYAHADIQGAPSIIIKSKNFKGESLEISEKTLEEACIFAASFSKAWKQFAEAQAYWVLPEQVSKTPQSGEFVPRGGFIIRGKRNYKQCKLELAIGLIELEGQTKVMCGPINSVKEHSSKYVIFVPGNIKKNDFAKKISNAFDFPINKIERILPPGGATIIKTVGVEL
jgi:predicted ribosome quality control (RQC) complex YloA/Tae2 family protein